MAATVALLGLPATAGTATAAVRHSNVAVVARSAHPPVGAALLTPGAAAAPMTLSIGLAPRDPAGFAAFTAAVNQPGSPSYHHFLKPGEYATRFGATPASVAPLVATLRAGGFAVQPFDQRLQLLTVRAPRTTVERFFSVTVNRYRDRAGHIGTVALGAPKVASTLRPLISGISGLNTLARWTEAGLNHGSRVHGQRTPHGAPAIGTVPTCSAASSAQSSVGGWTTAQLAQAYGFSAAYSRGAFGAGVTVGLYELSAYQQSDLAAYEKCFGIAPSVKVVNVDGGAGAYDSSTAFEPTLDVEEMLSLAPQANFLIYNGPNNGNGPNDLLAKIASDDKAMVVSTSWGICESINGQDPAALANETQDLQQMAAQGQSITAASGDNGTADCYDGSTVGPTPQVDDPASQPYVTGVGATSLLSVAPLKQMAWSSSSLSGGATGGGYSTVWPRPAWQTLPSSNPLSGSATRMVPDLSMSGDPGGGVLIYLADSGGWQTAGGTSAAAPLFASMLTLAESNCGITGTGLGSVNPTLYQLALNQPGDFSDVTFGSNAVSSDNSIPSYPATPGYDLASGLGSPTSGFFSGICASAPVASLTSLKAGNPTSVTVTATTTAPLNNGDTLSLTLPAGDTVPSSYGSVTATDDGAPVPMSVTAVSASTGSATANVVTFTCYATIATGSTLTFTIANVLNRLSLTPTQITVSSSAPSWPTVQAALPALTSSTPLWKVSDLASRASATGNANGPGALLAAPSGTTETLVTSTKSNQLAVLTGTPSSLRLGAPPLPALPAGAGKLTATLSASVIGSSTSVADVTTTGHVILATLTKGKWSLKDLTAVDKTPTSVGMPCIAPLTSGATTTTAVLTRTTSGKLQMVVVTGTKDVVNNLTSITGVTPAGPPVCATAPLSMVVAVRGTDGDLKELNLRLGATPTVLAFSTDDITSLNHLPHLAADPTSITVANQLISIASVVSGVGPGSKNQLVLSIAAIGTYKQWPSVNLTASSSLPQGLSNPVIVNTATRTEIVARTPSGGLELIVNNGQNGLWNGYDLSAAFGLGSGISTFSASAAGTTAAVTWAAANGHQQLAVSTSTF
jgi:Pro-kumamolisin, activation domain